MDDNDKNYNYSIEIGQIYKSSGFGNFQLLGGKVILRWVILRVCRSLDVSGFGDRGEREKSGNGKKFIENEWDL
jgi:hypothetical protein